MKSEIKIMIVEDESIIARSEKQSLEELGYSVSAKVVSGEESVKKAEKDKPDLVLMDIDLKGEMDGIEAAGIIHNLFGIPSIFVTAYADDKLLERAKIAEPFGYIIKPFEKRELHSNIEMALYKHKAEKKLKKTNQELQDSLAKVKLLSGLYKELMIKLEKANRELLKIASIDGLTGIANRRIFDETLENEWRRAVRSQSSLSMIMIDVDFFKNYNDSYGHQAGDNCLKEIAKSLSSTLKRPGDIAARYGGEEFAIILPDIDAVDARKLAEKALAKIALLKIPHNRSKVSNYVTVSLGFVSTKPKQGFISGDLLGEADKALYRAKADGRNRVSAAKITFGSKICPVELTKAFGFQRYQIISSATRYRLTIRSTRRQNRTK